MTVCDSCRRGKEPRPSVSSRTVRLGGITLVVDSCDDCCTRLYNLQNAMDAEMRSFQELVKKRFLETWQSGWQPDEVTIEGVVRFTVEHNSKE